MQMLVQFNSHRIWGSQIQICRRLRLQDYRCRVEEEIEGNQAGFGHLYLALTSI